MIRSLTGTVTQIDDEGMILDVSGFGIELFASGSLMAQAEVGARLTCVAYLQITDSGITMFGFSDDVERALFLEITKVPTVGGKMAISLLRRLDAPAIISAILAEDSARLTVPGIGKGRAEKICVNLRGKIEKRFAEFAVGSPQAPARGSVDREVAAALVGLGFTQSEAVRAVSSSRAELPDIEWQEEELLMRALSKLQKK